MEELKWLSKIEKELRHIVNNLGSRINPILLESVNYCLFPGGKRIRPILCIKAFESVGGTGNEILPYACALELIHTASLIKDDLPSMDNHKERRGKPSCWIKFGEATAMLASDVLSAEAYRILSLFSTKAPIREILNALISLCNGQDLDVRGIRSQEVNRLKTASLIEACFVIGGIVGGATDKQLSSLRQDGYEYGMEFQRKDDLVDREEDLKRRG